MRKIMNRRRGAGMTEYIILVGMIAILLTVVVERYKEQIRVTIVGSGNKFGNEFNGGGFGGSGTGGSSSTGGGPIKPKTP